MLSRKQPKYVNSYLRIYSSRFQTSSYLHNFFSDRFDADIPSSICATPDSKSLTIVKESSARILSLQSKKIVQNVL